MLYELIARRYFRENGKTLFPGNTIELDESVADEINRNEGPTLKLAPMNGQLTPERVADKKPAPRGRKKRVVS